MDYSCSRYRNKQSILIELLKENRGKLTIKRKIKENFKRELYHKNKQKLCLTHMDIDV